MFNNGTPDSWSNIPIHVLHSELKRRQDNGERPPCGSEDNKGEYNTGLHVFALFLILLLSTLACGFPIAARRWPKLPIPHYFLFISRHFGTGVLIATAFVHLLPTAFTSLHDPCLPSFWNDGYPPMPGAIAMASVFIVVGIEMFFATRGAGHVHGSEYDTVPLEMGERGIQVDSDEGTANDMNGGNGSAGGKKGKRTRRYSHPLYEDEEAPDGLHPTNLSPGQGTGNAAGYGHVPQHSPAVNDGNNDGDEESSPRGSTNSLDGLDMDLSPTSPTTPTARRSISHRQQHSHRPHHSRHESGFALPRTTHEIPSDPVAAAALEKKLLLQCFLLEAGILFHSVFIGIAVSVSVGPPFIVLLIAISFHQTFEGLALGSRIAAIPTLSPSSPKPWLMALAYGATTPIGQAIGLGVHNLYDPQSQVGLLMVGTMNAISSGLLLFAGLVELLAEDLLSDASYQVLKGRRRKEACVAVVAGAFLMALVGAWA